MNYELYKSQSKFGKLLVNLGEYFRWPSVLVEVRMRERVLVFCLTVGVLVGQLCGDDITLAEFLEGLVYIPRDVGRTDCHFLIKNSKFRMGRQAQP